MKLDSPSVLVALQARIPMIPTMLSLTRNVSHVNWAHLPKIQLVLFALRVVLADMVAFRA